MSKSLKTVCFVLEGPCLFCHWEYPETTLDRLLLDAFRYLIQKIIQFTSPEYPDFWTTKLCPMSGHTHTQQ